MATRFKPFPKCMRARGTSFLDVVDNGEKAIVFTRVSGALNGSNKLPALDANRFASKFASRFACGVTPLELTSLRSIRRANLAERETMS